MYKIREKQERFYEEKLTVDQVKKELGQQINEENKRINIDSAKKKAVLQHMDYDGFHQMVLGANLYPVKRGEIEQIYKYQVDTPRNFLATYMQITGAGYDEEIVKNLLQIKIDEKLEAPKS
jgi:hypothetical protein